MSARNCLVLIADRSFLFSHFLWHLDCSFYRMSEINLSKIKLSKFKMPKNKMPKNSLSKIRLPKIKISDPLAFWLLDFYYDERFFALGRQSSLQKNLLFLEGNLVTNFHFRQISHKIDGTNWMKCRQYVKTNL